MELQICDHSWHQLIVRVWFLYYHTLGIAIIYLHLYQCTFILEYISLRQQTQMHKRMKVSCSQILELHKELISCMESNSCFFFLVITMCIEWIAWDKSVNWMLSFIQIKHNKVTANTAVCKAHEKGQKSITVHWSLNIADQSYQVLNLTNQSNHQELYSCKFMPRLYLLNGPPVIYC